MWVFFNCMFCLLFGSFFEEMLLGFVLFSYLWCSFQGSCLPWCAWINI